MIEAQILAALDDLGTATANQIEQWLENRGQSYKGKLRIGSILHMMWLARKVKVGRESTRTIYFR